MEEDGSRERLLPVGTNEAVEQHGELQSERKTLEDAISKAGYGKFHYWLLCLCGFALSSEAVEIVSVSYALPLATCEYSTTSSQNGYFTAVIFLGMMVGGLVWGNMADLLGRRSILISSLAVNGLFAVGSSLAQSYLQFIICRFFSGVGVGGSLPVIFTYFSEFQPTNYRGVFVSLLASFWMCGTIIAAALAWLVIPMSMHSSSWFTYTSWHFYLTLCAIPSILSAVLFIFMPESPKYLFEIGEYERVYKILQKVFRINNGKNTASRYQFSGFNHQDHQLHKPSNVTSCGQFVKEFLRGTAEMFLSWSKLFSVSRIRVTLISVVIFSTIAFSYYGLMMWLPQLFEKFTKAESSSNVSVCGWSDGSANVSKKYDALDVCNPPSSVVYQNGLITSLACLPGNILSILCIDRVGRKPLLAGSMALTGVCVFFVWLIKNSSDFLIISCLFTSISAVSWNVLDVVTIELFPTSLRSTANGLLQAVSRVSAILGNVVFATLVNTHCMLPLSIVCALLLVGAFFSLLLPETRRREIE